MKRQNSSLSKILKITFYHSPYISDRHFGTIQSHSVTGRRDNGLYTSILKDMEFLESSM
jgi:hypothetical protein